MSTQESKVKRMLTFHMPQVPIWISLGVHVSDDCKNP